MTNISQPNYQNNKLIIMVLFDGFKTDIEKLNYIAYTIYCYYGLLCSK